MSNEAIDILLHYLRRLYLPTADQQPFLWAVSQLEALKNKDKKVARHGD